MFQITQKKNTQSRKVNNIDSKYYVMREMSISVFPNVRHTISSLYDAHFLCFCGNLCMTAHFEIRMKNSAAFIRMIHHRTRTLVKSREKKVK